MYFTHQRKLYNLEDYEIYPLTSLRIERKQVGLILCYGYFECGFRLLIPTLTINLLKYWRKSPCKLTANAYMYLSVIEVLVSTKFWELIIMKPTSEKYLQNKKGFPGDFCHLFNKAKIYEYVVVKGKILNEQETFRYWDPINMSKFYTFFFFNNQIIEQGRLQTNIFCTYVFVLQLLLARLRVKSKDLILRGTRLENLLICLFWTRGSF